MKSLKYILFWLIIISTTAIIYDSRVQIMNSKYVATFIPKKSYITKDGGLEFRKYRNGHFYIEALINKQKVLFLLDTGATDIILSEQDAKRIGIDLHKLKDFQIYNTANGNIKSGSTVLPEIQISNFVIKNIKVSINQSPLSISLLGMSFLKYFNFSITDDKLTLYPHILST